MDKSHQKQKKVSLLQRITIIFYGLVLVALILEIGLRVSGFIMVSLQEYKNLQAIKEKGSCRIMCLGESTTQNQYPPHLEEILNQRNLGIKFSVIDKGTPSVDTEMILSQLELNLDKYQPNIVITMMGCNDSRTMYYQDIPESDTWLFRHCRVYRFSRLIYMHILKKLKKEDIYSVNRSTPKLKTPDSSQSKPLKIERSSKNAIKLNPKNDSAYVGLGQIYRDQGRNAETEQTFKKAIELNPKNDRAYFELGWFYQDQGKFSQAEDALKKAIELNPKNDNAYVVLGGLYRRQGKFSQAEDLFKKAIELNPGNARAYFGLVWLYRSQGKFSQAEDLFKKAIELNPKNDNAYFELGWLYRDQGKLPQAEDLFKKAIKLNLNNDRGYRAILGLYEEIGKPELAKEYAEKANRLRLWHYSPVTVNNYRKLKEILDKRGIRLVCVQYPMRNVEPLRRIFKGDDEDIIFVDNEKIFKYAVRKEGYNAYFRDMFGGDFGHCTQKGNRLLAENIANVIFKELFSK